MTRESSPGPRLLFPSRRSTTHRPYSITSILVCHFILSLRRFDTSAAAPTYNEAGLQSRGDTHSQSMLQFAAQPSDTLPSFIASFAQPVHTEPLWSDSDSGETVNGDQWVKARDIELGAMVGKETT